MYRILVFLFILALSLVSCKKVEDEIEPSEAILGTYVLQVDGTEYDLVNSIELKNGGHVLSQTTVRNPGSNVNLGFNNYFTGMYTYENGLLTITQESYFQIVEANKIYEEKDKMVLVQTNSSILEFSVNEKFTELKFICPINAICIDESIYSKIK